VRLSCNASRSAWLSKQTPAIQEIIPAWKRPSPRRGSLALMDRLPPKPANKNETPGSRVLVWRPRLLSSAHGQRERECRFSPSLALYLDSSSVKLNEPTTERQAEARPFCLLLRFAHLTELLEHRRRASSGTMPMPVLDHRLIAFAALADTPLRPMELTISHVRSCRELRAPIRDSRN
jgi:hypothetical protein